MQTESLRNHAIGRQLIGSFTIDRRENDTAINSQTAQRYTSFSRQLTHKQHRGEYRLWRLRIEDDPIRVAKCYDMVAQFMSNHHTIVLNNKHDNI